MRSSQGKPGTARGALGITLLLAATALVWGCAEGAGSVDEPDPGVLDAGDSTSGDTGVDTTPSDTGADAPSDTSPDGEPADVVEGDLVLCVLNDQGNDGECADPAVLDFGQVPVSTTVTRTFRLENGLAEAVTVSAVDIASSAFATEIVTYDEAGERTIEALPFAIEPGAALYVEVAFTSGTSGGVLPANEVVVTLARGAAAEETLSVPMTGSMSGCLSGTGNCDGDETNGCETNTDETLEHCGACNQACELPNAELTCVDGACQFVACLPGFADCNQNLSDGCEIDLGSDAANCGACESACSQNNGTQACQGGQCVQVACNAGFADCNGTLADGCEQDIATSNVHCGACNSACSLPNADAFCDGGSCAFFACRPGFESCDGDTENGCEVNILDDESNCGGCGTTCSNDHGSNLCNDGQCTPICDALWGNCDNDRTNGCETRLDSLDHCGGCGVTCGFSGALASCTGGSCQLSSCEPGQANCNGNVADGCETSLDDTLAHCGACNVACVNPNGTTSCEGGQCTPQCAPGFADCNGNPVDGCESSLSSDAHCGGCNVACTLANAAATCSTGTCEVQSCSPGFADCDGDPANGCEVNTQTTTAHCGGCGNTCDLDNAATHTCVGGACQAATCDPGFANCNGNHTDGCEVNTQSTVAHCGACNNACSLPGAATHACASGTCQVVTCGSGLGNCDGNHANGCETNTNANVAHCGACGNACDLPNTATHGCSAGGCQVVSCDPGFANCDSNHANGCEVNTQTSVAHCGACGNACNLPNATATCSAGGCQILSCNPGFEDCDGNPANGCEVNTQTSTDHCGGCGLECDLASTGTHSCQAGSCRVVTCDAGFSNCDGNHANGCETNTNTNTSHCGGCGIVCDLSGTATHSCSAGSCQVLTCDPGRGNCDGNHANGCETNTDTTVAHCGACGNACNLPNATSTCSGGGCQILSCNPGFADCDGNPANGCEVNTQTTTAHCGGCGNVCDLPGTATHACVGGGCEVTTCDPGFANCDGNHANGCEVNTQTSVAHCGACGNACNLPNATATCSAGGCQILSCNPGFEDCDGNPANGCEVNTQSTPSHCGGCGITCDLANAATHTCVGGSCRVATCDPGFSNCDGNHANGCEVNTNTSASHCGACGTVCDLSNTATHTCVGGSCRVATCDPGFSNCDGNHANGCEVNTNTSTANCGACGVTCSLNNTASHTCSSGSCQVASCNSGFGNCDGNHANGCETNTNTNTSHCGGCGIVCDLNGTATHSCSGGSCQVLTCDPGRGNCDGNHANGCETNTNTSVTHCGACGNTCNLPNATSTCSGGSCQILSCNPGFANCDGNHANGCEVNLNTNGANCGSCGNVCSLANANSVCSGGSCQVGSCIGTWRNCDGNHANGCEINTANNASHCGACNNVCNAANASSTCSASTCQVSSCNFGFCNADGQYSNGCEVNLEPSLACASDAIYLGQINGDTGGGSSRVTYTGYGEKWFRVRVREDSNSCRNVRSTFTLTMASGVDYDLFVHCANCSGGVRASQNGGSADERVEFYVDDNCFWPDSDDRDYYIRVEHWSANVCAPYTLTVIGDLSQTNAGECD